MILTRGILTSNSWRLELWVRDFDLDFDLIFFIVVIIIYGHY
ncbi:hypothetical protein H1P_1480006 [Hyella patelloides LEGE 07179]|uniref:Uncharacterized protein n=1 Tax=Hyella patelloides LEGE 07179 TaxID=945734 RepID=A0A563VLW7_9CYAN|nr:hypothetical protein H1P_1480006 [Hyella patelloides LEGE 07179]